MKSVHYNARIATDHPRCERVCWVTKWAILMLSCYGLSGCTYLLWHSAGNKPLSSFTVTDAQTDGTQVCLSIDWATNRGEPRSGVVAWKRESPPIDLTVSRSKSCEFAQQAVPMIRKEVEERYPTFSYEPDPNEDVRTPFSISTYWGGLTVRESGPTAKSFQVSPPSEGWWKYPVAVALTPVTAVADVFGAAALASVVGVPYGWLWLKCGGDICWGGALALNPSCCRSTK